MTKSSYTCILFKIYFNSDTLMNQMKTSRRGSRARGSVSNRIHRHSLFDDIITPVHHKTAYSMLDNSFYSTAYSINKERLKHRIDSKTTTLRSSRVPSIKPLQEKLETGLTKISKHYSKGLEPLKALDSLQWKSGFKDLRFQINKFEQKESIIAGRPNTYKTKNKELLLQIDCIYRYFPLNMSFDVPEDYTVETYANFNGEFPQKKNYQARFEGRIIYVCPPWFKISDLEAKHKAEKSPPKNNRKISRQNTNRIPSINQAKDVKTFITDLPNTGVTESITLAKIQRLPIDNRFQRALTVTDVPKKNLSLNQQYQDPLLIVPVTLRIVTDSPIITITMTQSETMHRSRRNKNETFTAQQYETIYEKIKEYRQNKMETGKSSSPEMHGNGGDIEERNRIIAANYLSHKCKLLASQQIRTDRQIEEARKKSNIRKNIEHRRKLDAINRHYEIKHEAQERRSFIAAYEYITALQYIWFVTIQFFKIMKGIRMRVMLSKKLRFLHNKRQRCAILLQQGIRNFLCKLPGHFDSRSLIEGKCALKFQTGALKGRVIIKCKTIAGDVLLHAFRKLSILSKIYNYSLAIKNAVKKFNESIQTKREAIKTLSLRWEKEIMSIYDTQEKYSHDDININAILGNITNEIKEEVIFQFYQFRYTSYVLKKMQNMRLQQLLYAQKKVEETDVVVPDRVRKSILIKRFINVNTPKKVFRDEKLVEYMSSLQINHLFQKIKLLQKKVKKSKKKFTEQRKIEAMKLNSIGSSTAFIKRKNRKKPKRKVPDENSLNVSIQFKAPDYAFILWAAKIEKSDLIKNIVQKIFSKRSFFPYIRPEELQALILTTSEFVADCREAGKDALKELKSRYRGDLIEFE